MSMLSSVLPRLSPRRSSANAASPARVSLAATGLYADEPDGAWLLASPALSDLSFYLLKGRISMKTVKRYLLAAILMLASLCSQARAQTNLPFGQAVTGAVTVESSIALPSKYSFSANTGDLVNFTLVATSGSLVPEIQLYNSTGTMITSNYAGSPFGCGGTVVQMNTVQLPASPGGTYAVWVTDCNGSNGGNYSLYAQRTNNPGGTVLTLPFGSEETGAISAVAQSNTYAFSASAGDEIDFILDATSGSLVPAIEVYNPNGTLLASNYAGSPFGCGGTNVEMDTIQIPTTPATGTYTVLINDCSQINSGNYEIYVQRTDAPGPPVTALVLDQQQDGTISAETQNNTYTYTANANDVFNFTVDTTNGSLVPAIQIYNPNGTLLTSNYAGSPFGCGGTNVEINTVTFPIAGTYTVLISDCSTTNTGSYVIFTQRTNNPKGAVNLPIGATVTGLVGSVAESSPYTFSANANDVIDFTLVTTTGTLVPAIQLYQPNGALLSSNYAGSPFGCGGTGLEMNTVTLPTAGIYTVLILDCSTFNTGNYALYAQRTNNPKLGVPILWGQVETGMIGTAAQSSTYTFPGSTGNLIDLTMTGTTTGGALVPKIRLYNPDGSQLTSNYSGSPFGCGGTTVELSSVTLEQNGNYTVLLGDCSDTNTGNFSLLSECTGTCPLPAPVLTSLSPTSVLAGSGGFTLTVNGSNFVNQNANSVVQWNGNDLATTWVSTTQMTAAVPGTDTATAGCYPISVFTAPGVTSGGTSSPISFCVNNPVPTTTSPLLPASAIVSTAPFTLTVNGTNFVSSSQVMWNGNSLAITSQTATQLKATVPATDCTTAGPATVAVFNPMPGGGTSSPALMFSCNNPFPATTSLSPTSAAVGSPAFTLTVNGSNFVQSSTVNWNGSGLATTYVSATQLTATVPATDCVTISTNQVTVTNPTPGGGTSSPALTLNCETRTPVMTSPTPSSTLAGSSVTFTWDPVYQATGYALWIGTTGTGSGSDNLYYSGQQASTVTSLTPSGLPVNGETIYVRLIAYFGTASTFTTYTYTSVTGGILTTPAPGSTLTGPSVTFGWTAGAGATGYALLIGSTGPGSGNLYNSGEQASTATSLTVNRLPTNGETIYVRLITYYGIGSGRIDYTYTAATAAVLTTPASGSTLAGPNATFSWTAGTNATGYALWIGSSQADPDNLYYSGEQASTVTSLAVSGLPVNGETIYVRLITYYGAASTFTTYTYNSATGGILTTPTPGSTLAGPSVTFGWTAGVNATGYALWIGSTGPGSDNLYYSGELASTVTSRTVSALPVNGETIYVRLITYYGSSSGYIDYTYAATTAAVLTAPTPGSTLGGSSVTFSWSSAANATGYALWAGTTGSGSGSDNLYYSGEQASTVTSLTASGLPVNGETIYVRLITYHGSNSTFIAYTYTSATGAILTMPAPSSTLAGQSVSFSWTAGAGATGYALWIGSTGTGSDNLYYSGEKAPTVTSLTVNGLPTNGETIYVRLITYNGSSSGYINYTYTAESP